MSTLLQRDKAAIWHPYTQHQTADPPLVIMYGDGAYLFDAEGKRYLDLIASWWVNTQGHAHSFIAEAIYKQALTLEHVLFSDVTHEPAIRLAEKLLQLLPRGFSKVFYSDNGSTAVETAIKMAYQFWRNRGEKNRHRFLAFTGGYHGDTFGAMAVGRTSMFFQHFTDLMFTVDFSPYPATWEDDLEVEHKEKKALQWLGDYFDRYHATVAALIIEPLIQGAAGMRICRPIFLRAVEALARQYSIIVIYDEVMTGLGRTGPIFACEKAGTQPDIICLSKGLTGGFLPLAVTVCRDTIYRGFLDQDINAAFIHGHTYSANPLGCAAALAALQLLVEETTLRQRALIEDTHRRMAPLLRGLPKVKKWRYCGTVAAFDIAVSTHYGSPQSREWQRHFLSRGLLLRPLGQVVYLLPPYSISVDDLADAYVTIAEVIETAIN